MDVALHYFSEHLPTWMPPLLKALEAYAEDHETPEGTVVFCPDAGACPPPLAEAALVAFVPATAAALESRESALALRNGLLQWAKRSAVLLAPTRPAAVTVRDLLGIPSARISVLPLPATSLPERTTAPRSRATVLAIPPLNPETVFGAIRALRLADIDASLVVAGAQGEKWTRPGGIAGLHELLPGHDARRVTDWRDGVDDAAVIVLGDASPDLGFELREVLAAGRPALVPAGRCNDAHLDAAGASALRYPPQDAVGLAAALTEALRGERAIALADAAAAAVVRESWATPARSLFDALCAAVAPDDGAPPSASLPATTSSPSSRLPAARPEPVVADERLRVLFFSPLPAFGGHATIIRSFIHGLCHHRLRPVVTVVAAADAGPEGSLLREVLGDAAPERARIVPGHLVEQALAEEVDDVDVVYSVWPHTLNPPNVRVPLLTTFYDMNWRHFDHLPAAERQLLDAQTPRWIERAHIVCSSEFIAGELERHFGVDAGGIPIVPTPTPDVLPTPAAEELARVRRRFALPSQFLLCPAGHHPSKNYAALLAACRLLRAEGTPISIVATGLNTDRLVGPDVIGLGYVGTHELRALFELSAGVVQPTLYEAGSFPMLEALACNRPAAVSDIPAITEQVRRWDLRVETFDSRDPVACGRAMRAILAGARASDAEHNADAVRRYTWQDFTGGYLEAMYAAAGRELPRPAPATSAAQAG